MGSWVHLRPLRLVIVPALFLRTVAGFYGLVRRTAQEITLEFSGDTEDSEAGVLGVASTTDAEMAFSFTEVLPRVGTPKDLLITDGGVTLLITFTTDYSGESYTYTDTDGTPHNDTFPADDDEVSY